MKIIYTLLCLGFAMQLAAQVPNDLCSDAIPIGEVTDMDFVTAGANTDGPLHIDSPCPSATEPEIDSIYNDIWYLYTPTFTGHCLFTTCGTADFDTKIAAYIPGAACPPLDEDLLTCNEDGTDCAESTSELIFAVTEGEVYLLRLGGYGETPPGLSGQGTFSVSEYIPGVPNDFCADAFDIGLGTHNVDNFGTITDGPIHDDSNPCFQFGDPTIMADVWYTFTPDFTGSVNWNTCGSVTFDTRLGVYGPNVDCSNLTSNDLYACNDDGAGCPDYSSSLFFDVEEGMTYLLRLGGWNGSIGNGSFELINEDAPEPPANNDCTNAIVTEIIEPGGSNSTDGTTISATFNPETFVFPPCIGNTNGGEFAEVWYSFNNQGIQEIELNLISFTTGASFFADLWEDCTTPTDTLAIMENCILLNGDSTVVVTERLGQLSDTPTDYLLRITTRLTSDAPGDFTFQLLGEGTSSVDTPEALNGEIVLLPNPASSFINVKIPLKNSSNLKYTITDVVGREVMAEKLGDISGDHHQQIEVSSLSEGIYFVNLYLDDQPISIRFIKQ